MSRALPDVARLRRGRIAAQSPAPWSDDAASLLAMSRVGFDFVGEVVGAVAAMLTTTDRSSCGYQTGQAVVRLGGQLALPGTVGYPRRAQSMYVIALGRLRDEAVARGADGVVGVTPHVRRLEDGLTETVLAGQAVRARSGHRPAKPFLTRCNPVEVSRLLSSGWVPVDLHVAVEMGVRHDDTDTEHSDQLREDRSMRNFSFEVTGFSELQSKVRTSVRDKLRAQLRGVAADGALVSDIQTSARHAGCTVLLHRTDRVVRATGWADSLAQFGEPTGPPSLVLALGADS